MTSTRGRLAFFVFLGLPASLGFRTPDDEPKSYPRSLGEIKTMIQVLAPRKGSGASTENEFLSRLVQYRYLSGVPFENLTWDAHDASLAYHASLVCSKLNQMTHTPTRPAGMSDRDWELSQTGARESNLFSGLVEPGPCVDGWMDDSDPKNIDRVGHRRWCLNPSMEKTGFGSAGTFAAMYAWDHSNRSVPPWDFVSYPARGYMPTGFFGNKYAWSVSPNPAVFTVPAESDVKVTIQPANAKLAPTGPALKLDYFKVNPDSFGSGPAIIFRPAAFNASQEAIYLVDISGLKRSNGTKEPIRYVTHFVNLQKAQEGREGGVAATKYFQNRLAVLTDLPEKVDEVVALGDLLELDGLRLAEASVRQAASKALADLLKDPALKREFDASQLYRQLVLSEQKAGKSKTGLAQVAISYREFAQSYKETRAGKNAAEAFERLKGQLQ